MTFQSINEDKISKVTDDSLTFGELLEHIDMNEKYIKMIRVKLKKSMIFLKTSVKLAADSSFFNEYSHIHLFLSTLSVCLIPLGELYLMLQPGFR